MRMLTLIVAAGLVTTTSGVQAQSEKPEKQGERLLDREDRPERGRMQHRRHHARDGAPRIDREKIIAEFDADGDGELNEAERKAAGDAMRERTRAKALERFDADGDGELSPEEGQRARRAMRSGERKRGIDRDRENFRSRGERVRREIAERFDTDGDGVLNENERLEAREAMRLRREKEQAVLLEKFDADGDGELSRVERQAAQDAHRAKREEQRQQLIERFDADGDGELTGDERRAAGDEMKRAQRARKNAGRLDENRDRSLDADELAEGMKLIEDGDSRGDFNGDGVVDAQDAAALVEIAEKMRGL